MFASGPNCDCQCVHPSGNPTIQAACVFGAIDANSVGYPKTCVQLLAAYNAVAAAVASAAFPAPTFMLRVLAECDTNGDVVSFTNQLVPWYVGCFPWPVFTAGLSQFNCPPTGPGGIGTTAVQRMKTQITGPITDCADTSKILSNMYCAVAFAPSELEGGFSGVPPGLTIPYWVQPWFSCAPGTGYIAAGTISLTPGTLPAPGQSIVIDSAGGAGGGNVEVDVWLGCACEEGGP